MFSYRLNAESEVPVYRQLTDQIHAEIRSGALKTGTQLPTVREMAERTHLSCGTVKRVYDRLRELGDIEMTRRRGSFVKYVRVGTDSRRLMAMNAIDDMLRRLAELNFSPKEIQIFVGLKLREWGVRQSGIRIGVVTPCAEIGGDFEAQLQTLGNVHVFESDMARVREYPYILDEQTDILLCTEEDAEALRGLIADADKVLPVALGPERGTLLAAAARGGNLAVVCADAGFARAAGTLLPNCSVGIGAVPIEAETLIVPANLTALDERTRADVEERRAGGSVITLRYEIDAGSMLYLKERIGRLREERQMRPVTMEL